MAQEINIALITEKCKAFIGLGKYYFYYPSLCMHNTYTVLQAKLSGNCHQTLLEETAIRP